MRNILFAGSWISKALSLVSLTLSVVIIYDSLLIHSIDYLGICVLLIYLIIFSHYFGVLLLTHNHIIAFDDFIWKASRFQFGFSVRYDNIIAIEYVIRDFNSIGISISNQRRGTIGLSYLEITCTDNTIKRVLLNKYSFRQWNQIHQIIVERTNEIVIVNTPHDLKKYMGYK